jgi:lysophospholipase L1-like esterase
VQPISEKRHDLEQDAEPPTTVLIGTSVTKRINPTKIVGKSTCKFVNCSTSGDTIQDASDKLDKLYAGSLTDFQDQPVGTNLDIRNIILSVGTNDIRRKKNGVSSLYLPVRALLKKANDLFPNCQIYVQSVIPMGYEFSWTANNVMSFNPLLRRCAKEIPNCCYLDVFDEFIHRGYPVKSLFHDHLHPSARGAAVLARSFIAITRGSNFNIRV